MKNTFFIGILMAVILAIAGYFVWAIMAQPSESTVAQDTVPETKNTYATSTFSVQYPSNYVLNEAYTYDQFAGKPIAGIKFAIPETLAAGTNLSAFDTGVSIESLPRAKNCTGDIYMPADVKAIDMTIGSTTYSIATSTGAAAGSTYEEQVFAIKDSKPCTAIRYSIHSSNIGNYPQEGDKTVREFDRGALLQIFDGIRDSVVFSQ